MQMTRKNDERMLSARRAIAALRRDLRGTKEELAVLRQEHFGQSSEKEPAQEDNEDHDLFLDGLSEEPKVKVVGKRAGKKPQDITTEIHNIYPDNRTCCTCNSEMPLIGSWESEKFQIVPEHVICIKRIHHKCACNREVCKDSKPVAAKSQSYMMKGCKYGAKFMLEAAVQKFDEHSTNYRMESRLKNCNLNVSRQVIGRNIARVAGFLKPIQDQLLAHATEGHVAHMDETPVRVQAPGKGKYDTGHFLAICRDERR
jgi:transposase